MPAFPGMNPYLEGALWPDVHQALATKIRQLLVPQIRPRYVARLELYIVEDTDPEAELGIMYPDIEIVQRTPSSTDVVGEPTMSGTSVAAAPLTIPMLAPISVRIPTVELRLATTGQLVTCIEILSPVNKREPGLQRYRHKRQRLHEAGVHLLELDLLRRGTRSLSHPRLLVTDYQLTLTRATARVHSVWPIALADALPMLPVPLHEPDPDVVLDLGAALRAIAAEADYDGSIDYGAEPPPPRWVLPNKHG